MRIGGLASGMDIDSLVTDLMKAERMPLNKLKQKKTQIEWRRDDYRSMNTLFLDFRKELTAMKMSSTYRVRTTSSTNDARVSAVANSSASKSSFSISSVKQLAAAETIKNGGAIAGSGFDSSKALYNQSFSSTTNVWNNGVIESKSIVVVEASDKIDLGIVGFNSGAIPTDDATLKKWCVKVNGQSYQVVGSSDPLDADNKVRFNVTTGQLEFRNPIAKDSSIKVDYVANTKTETLTLTKDTKAWQLSRGALDTITNNQIKFDNAGTPDTLQISSTVGTDGSRVIMHGTTQVGTVNVVTGLISFNDNMPLPPEGSTTPMTLEINYDQKYSDFSVSSYTSKGKVTENFLIQGSDSLDYVINKVNSSTAGVNLFYDQNTKQMTLTRSETGDFNLSGNEMETKGLFINDLLKFEIDPDPTTPDTGYATVTTQAANAKFTINGLETSRTSNTFEMNGVTFTLKQTFNTDANPANHTDPAISVNINNDSSKVYDNIKAFIDKYNELIDKVQKKTSETYYKDYLPLTDEQRETLSDKQQELWEEKSKSGLLRRDSILNGALLKMRHDFYSPVLNDSINPIFKQLSDIGITTSANYLEGGKLEINEVKLKKAIEEDPTSVEKLFNGDGVTSDQKGIAHRLTNSINETMDKIKARAGNVFSTNQQFTLGKELLSVDKQIDRFEDRLKQVETRYWRQFTAMEKSIQRSNNQSTYLMQQFSGV